MPYSLLQVVHECLLSVTPAPAPASLSPLASYTYLSPTAQHTGESRGVPRRNGRTYGRHPHSPSRLLLRRLCLREGCRQLLPKQPLEAARGDAGQTDGRSHFNLSSCSSTADLFSHTMQLLHSPLVSSRPQLSYRNISSFLLLLLLLLSCSQFPSFLHVSSSLSYLLVPFLLSYYLLFTLPPLLSSPVASSSLSDRHQGSHERSSRAHHGHRDYHAG